MKTIIKSALLFVALGFLSACGAPGSAIQDNNTTVSEADLDQLNFSLEKAENALNGANTQINAFDLFGGANGINQGIREAVDQAILAVEQVDNQLLDMRARIDAQIATLDPSIPSHQRMIEQANEIKARLDNVRVQFKDAVHNVAEAIGDLVVKIDDKIASMDPGNPLTWGVSLYWSGLRGSLVDAEMRLGAI